MRATGTIRNRIDRDKAFQEFKESRSYDMILTEAQEKAVKSLERALKQCHKANVYLHNHYGTLKAFDGNLVDNVNDTKTEISCEVGRIVNSDINLDSWADDAHYVHLDDRVDIKKLLKNQTED